MPKFFLRDAATKYLREEHGLPVSDSTLANRAAVGLDPKFTMFSRRALYSREILDAFASAQSGRDPRTAEEIRAAAVELASRGETEGKIALSLRLSVNDVRRLLNRYSAT
jgi:hypothetical protein